MANKQGFLSGLQEKYKFVVLKKNSFEEKASFSARLYTILLVAFCSAVLLVAGTVLLIIYSPLKEYIPGHTDASLRKEIVNITIRADSLENVVKTNRVYLDNLKQIMTGQAGSTDPGNRRPSHMQDSIELSRTHPREDSLLRIVMETENQVQTQGLTHQRR